MALAYRWGSTVKSFFLASAFMGGWSLAVMALVGWAKAGLRLAVHPGHSQWCSWMSPPALLALGTGQVGIQLKAGRPTTAVPLTRAIGVLIIAVTVTWLLLAVFRGRLHPVGGLKVRWAPRCYFSVVQPWYLLWAIIPLAAWATRPGIPDRGNRRKPHRRHLRTHCQRRPVRHLPDRGRHLGQRPDRDRDRRADAQHAAVARIPNNEPDAANTGSSSEAPTPTAPPGAYAESP